MKVTELLQADGYSVDEINTAIKEAENKLLQIDGNAFKIKPERESIVRKYCILDIIANFGRPIPSDKTTGCLIVPGYSTYWGMPQNDVIRKAIEIAPMLEKMWHSTTDVFDDIQWLTEKGFVKNG
ncbi:MAG: hypothetical protein IJ601_10850 [Acidaminococcaceae bacterium]|nr:hypothetical protein [Acidaminococcaceae bacterium]